MSGEKLLIIKVTYNGITKKIPYSNEDVTFDEFLLMVQRVFKTNEPIAEPFSIKYLDDEKDWITISDTDELNFAMSTNDFLKIHISSPAHAHKNLENIDELRRELTKLQTALSGCIVRLGEIAQNQTNINNLTDNFNKCVDVRNSDNLNKPPQGGQPPLINNTQLNAPPQFSQPHVNPPHMTARPHSPQISEPPKYAQPQYRQSDLPPYGEQPQPPKSGENYRPMMGNYPPQMGGFQPRMPVVSQPRARPPHPQPPQRAEIGAPSQISAMDGQNPGINSGLNMAGSEKGQEYPPQMGPGGGQYPPQYRPPGSGGFQGAHGGMMYSRPPPPGYPGAGPSGGQPQMMYPGQGRPMEGHPSMPPPQH